MNKLICGDCREVFSKRKDKMSTKFNENTYEIKLNGCDGSTTLLVNLNPFELAFINYLSELSYEISQVCCQPTIDVDKFPSDEYYRKQLDEFEMENYDDIIKLHEKAFEKIRARLNEKENNRSTDKH